MQTREAKSAFFDAFYEVQRLMIEANTQLLKGSPKLDTTLEGVGKKIASMEISNKIGELERAGQGIMTPEVWNHYFELLDKNPQVKAAYKTAGGSIFLERAKE